GTAQTIGSLHSPNGLAFSGSGGTITSVSGAAATLVDTGGVAGVWGGQITGNVAFQKAGNTAFTVYSDNTFSGALQLLGSTTTLTDSGRFSGASSIDINGG